MKQQIKDSAEKYSVINIGEKSNPKDINGIL